MHSCYLGFKAKQFNVFYEVNKNLVLQKPKWSEAVIRTQVLSVLLAAHLPGTLEWSKLGWTVQNSYKVDVGCQSDLLALKRPQHYHLVPHPRETVVGGRKQNFPYFANHSVSSAQSIAWSLIIFLASNCMIHEGQLLFNKDDVYASR